jgi:hypothetical protein
MIINKKPYTKYKMPEFTSDSELACEDYCIYDAGYNCKLCNRLTNTRYWRNKMKPKEKAIAILINFKNNVEDNLYRAKASFNGLTKQQMQTQFFNSGKTKQQILDDYQREYDEVVAAIEFVKEK